MFLLLFVVHNCRNEEINVSYVTKLFRKHILICNPKFCINQEIKVNEGGFLIFFLVILCQRQGWGHVQLTKYSSTPSTPNIYQVQVLVKYSFF